MLEEAAGRRNHNARFKLGHGARRPFRGLRFYPLDSLDDAFAINPNLGANGVGWIDLVEPDTPFLNQGNDKKIQPGFVGRDNVDWVCQRFSG